MISNRGQVPLGQGVILGLMVLTVGLLPASGDPSEGKGGLREEEVEGVFRGNDLERKLEWIWRIPKIDARAPDRATRLVELGMNDPDEIVRQNTLLTLEEIGHDRYLPYAEQGLKDDRESVRWFARYAAGRMTGSDPIGRGKKGGGKGILACKYRAMIGYYGPHTPKDEWGWKFMDEFRRLGYGYAFGNPELMVDLWCPDKPSWRSGQVSIPGSFWEAMRKYEEMGIDFYFVFDFKPRSGYQSIKSRELGQRAEDPGWQAHFYEEGLEEEIRKTWDKDAPRGWTLLDEFRLHVRNIMRANKENGDMIDGWLFFSEPTRYNFFGDNDENVGLLIRAGMEEARKISPEAYLGFHGTLGPRLDLQRSLYAHGASGIYAAAFRRYLNTMPEGLYLTDGATRGAGWLETFNSFYSQANAWDVVDPRDGKIKVVDMERILNVIGEESGATFGPRTFMTDTPPQRERHADYWSRSILLALSTGFVCKLSAVYHNNPFWSWGSPSGIGVQFDVPQVRELRDRDIAGEFEKGRIPRKPRDMSHRTEVMEWTFYEIFRKRGREGLYQAIDGYLAERRPDCRKPSYFASMILNHLLGEATFISRLSLKEPDFGLRFHDDASGRMITALGRAATDEADIELGTRDREVRVLWRERDKGIREEVVGVRGGRFPLHIGSNPVYVVGEIVDPEWMRVSLLNGGRRVEKGERGIFEIAYQADRDLSGGSLEVEIPPGWIPSQVGSGKKEGYVDVEPGPGVAVGKTEADGRKIRVAVDRMGNGHTLRVIYGDARPESFLFDMGEDQFGPVSLDHEKMQGNMIYYPAAGDGFDHEGLPRAREEFWAQWPSSGGCGIPDNDPRSIYQDMALSATYDGWKFMIDAVPDYRYQVKVFLKGSGEIDDQLSSQRVEIGGLTFDSRIDRLVHRVSPGTDGRVVVRFVPDSDGNSMNRYFEGDPREDIHYSHRRPIPDNTRICYLYGLEVMPEHLGGGPAAAAVTGANSFVLRTRSADGKVTELRADLTVGTQQGG